MVNTLFGGITAIFDQNAPEKMFNSPKTAKMRALKHILVQIDVKKVLKLQNSAFYGPGLLRYHGLK